MNVDDFEDDDSGVIRTAQRSFTRLTALASWRSEYIIRTRLLRSLARGKPAQSASSSSASRGSTALPVVMYKSQLLTTVNHLHATFGSGASSQRHPRFVHGADDIGAATSSDPSTLKVDNWGLSDPQFFLQFAERFPGDAQYGLGPGEIVGVPNSMDVSRPFGMAYGEGFPGGATYYRSSEEMRGRFLAGSSALSAPALGIPKLVPEMEAVTAVWIAKTNSIPSVSDGMTGLLTGSSLGVISSYSLGALGSKNSHTRDHRFDRGEITARWVLSPGVPIVAIAADDEYSPARYAQNRIWAVVVNALGEIFYLTKFPKRNTSERGTRNDPEVAERNAWLAGRSVYWKMVEVSRRSARLDPYADSAYDGSYSPRTSWNGMCLSSDQIQHETREIEAYAARKPKDFQKSCLDWDMQRRLLVDFAGDDGNFAGENVVVIRCSDDEASENLFRRYSRCRVRDYLPLESASTPPLTVGSTEPTSPQSIFGTAPSPTLSPTVNIAFEGLGDTLACTGYDGSVTPRPMVEEWRTTNYSTGGLKIGKILSTAMDVSLYAIQTTSEDQLLGFTGRSTTSSPSMTPQSPTSVTSNPADVPGHRARLFAIGTKLGTVMIWDMRSPTPVTTASVSIAEPVRVIHTDSPEISSLALTSLYLVHGGNDGLVQTWDPLGSTLHPIRTLHSRFSSRARRDLARANASPQGVGINLYAAGAISLDPDPTVLRGMVSLGNQLRYWSFSSSAADQYKSSKRRLRHGQRGSNAAADKFTGVVRSNLKDYIAHERSELDREKLQRRQESQRFAGRYGTEIFDGSEEEMLAYAAMLSQETHEQDMLRRMSDTSTTASTANSSVVHSTWESAPVTSKQSPSPGFSAGIKSEDELDADIAEAIRQSLATSPSSRSFDIPIRQAKQKGRKFSSAKTSPRPSPILSGSASAAEMNDLDFVLQLSLAEEQSKHGAHAAAAAGPSTSQSP
jgi:hypothetical protein